MKVSVDTDRCMASGWCVAACPQAFAQDDIGMVVLLDPNPGPELSEQVREAVRTCPTSAIEARD